MDSFQFLFDIPFYQLTRRPQRVAGGLWRQSILNEISTDQLITLVQSMALGLLQKGVKKGDRIILYTDKYSMEWLAVDMAIMSAGAISVPLQYPVREDDLSIILQRIEPSIIIYTTPVEFPGYYLNFSRFPWTH